MTELIARYKPGTNVPAFASSAVLAGRFVSVQDALTDQGDYPVAHAAAGSRPFGVAESDSGSASLPATSTERRINVVRRGAVARVVAGDDLTAPEEVMVGTGGKAIPLADVEPDAASLTEGTLNAQLIVTANEPGEGGNDITIALVVTDANVADSVVDVDGNAITVILKSTDVGSGTITETYAGLVAALNEHDVASQLITASDGAGNGSGTVVALAQTPLSGGTDGGEGVAVGRCLTDTDTDEIADIDLY